MPLNRRQFVQVLGATSLARLAHPLAYAAAPGTRLVYIASDAQKTQGIHVFLAGEGPWRHLQFMPSRRPLSLALGADGRTLFVANAVHSVDGLPTGSVESFRIEPSTGTLTPLSHRKLALSATEPGHLAVSPDGRQLAVACTGGGSFLVVPIEDDGSLLPVRSLRKELGCSLHPDRQQRSHPQQVLFDTHSRLLGADLGTDRISIFEHHDETLHVQQRLDATPGSGPFAMALDRTGSRLCVGSGLQPQLTTFRYNAGTGHLLARNAQHSDARFESCSAILAHPRADRLLSAWRGNTTSALTAWNLDLTDGSLDLASEWSLPGHITQLAVLDPHDDLFLALSTAQDQVMRFGCDARTGQLTRVTTVAHVPGPRAAVVLQRDLQA